MKFEYTVVRNDAEPERIGTLAELEIRLVGTMDPPTIEFDSELAVSMDRRTVQRTVHGDGRRLELTYTFEVDDKALHDELTYALYLGNDDVTLDATDIPGIEEIMTIAADPGNVPTTRVGCTHLERSLSAWVVDAV